MVVAILQFHCPECEVEIRAPFGMPNDPSIYETSEFYCCSDCNQLLWFSAINGRTEVCVTPLIGTGMSAVSPDQFVQMVVKFDRYLQSQPTQFREVGADTTRGDDSVRVIINPPLDINCPDPIQEQEAELFSEMLDDPKRRFP